jgi:hypothetical protein
MKAYKGSRSMVLFPWGVGHVASCLLSKLVGLLHEVIYVGGPWKVHNRLRLADTLTHVTQCYLFLYVNCNVFYITEVWFFLIYSNNQMENIKVDMSDHGAWSKHLTLHWSICIMPLIIEILPKLCKFERSTQICMHVTPMVQNRVSFACFFCTVLYVLKWFYWSKIQI